MEVDILLPDWERDTWNYSSRAGSVGGAKLGHLGQQDDSTRWAAPGTLRLGSPPPRVATGNAV